MLRIPALAAIAKVLLITAAVAAPNVVLVTIEDPSLQETTRELAEFRAQATSLGRFYVSPTAPATGAALHTGLHEFRGGVSHTMMGRSLLRPGLPTLPEMFRAAGYRTGIVGRWHLGDAYPCRPEDRGYDDVFVHGGGQIGDAPDYWGNGAESPMVRRNDGWKRAEGSVPGVFYDEAVRWLEARMGEGKPSFLHLAVEGEVGPDFSRLTEALEKGGAGTETIVVLLRTGRAVGAGTPNEAGVVAECLVRWPGKIAAGRKSEGVASGLDLLPTLTDLCEVARPEGWAGDGVSLAAEIRAEKDLPQGRLLFTQAGGWPGDDAASRFRATDFAVRDDRWGLVGLELFDLVADPRQQKNLFAENMSESQRFLTAYGRWWEGVLPTVGEPVRYIVGSAASPVVRLTAFDWWPSREADQVRGAEVAHRQGQIRAFLRDAQVAATRNPLPATSGHWKITAAREGNYEISFSLVPPEAGEEDRRALGRLRAGVAHVRAGREEVQMAVQAGATRVTIPMDFDPGPVDLEVWMDGQLLNDRILGAFYASLEWKGARKVPRLEIEAKPAR